MNKIVNHDAKIASIIHQVSTYKSHQWNSNRGFSTGANNVRWLINRCLQSIVWWIPKIWKDPGPYDGWLGLSYTCMFGACIGQLLRCKDYASHFRFFQTYLTRKRLFIYPFSIWPDLTFCNYPFRLGQTLLNLTIWSIHNRREIRLRLTHTSNLWGAAPLITSFNVGWF